MTGVAPTIAEREREMKAREAALARRMTRLRSAESATFVADLVRQGMLPASLRATATTLLARAPDDAAAQFAEDQPAETDQAAMRRLLAGLTRPVDLMMHAAGTDLLRLRADPTVEGITAAADVLVKARAKAGDPISFRSATEIVARSVRAGAR
jgi:hypothetical protein